MNISNDQPQFSIVRGSEPGTFSVQPVGENSPAPITPKTLTNEEVQAFANFKGRSAAAASIDLQIAVADDALPRGVLARMYRGSDPLILVDRRALNDLLILMAAQVGLTDEIARDPDALTGQILTLTEDFTIHHEDGSTRKMEVLRNEAPPPKETTQRDAAFAQHMLANVARAPQTVVAGQPVRLLRLSELMRQS